MTDLGRVLIALGALLVLAGLALTFSDRIPWLGKLPGDFVIRRDGFTLYFPLATGLLISVVVTLLVNLFGRR